MPSANAIARMQDQRLSAQASARRAREAQRAAEDEARAARKQTNAALKSQAAQWAGMVAMSGLALTSGLIVGGQLSRVNASWGRWSERAAFVLGWLALIFARKRWHYMVAFALLGAGGVQISDFSRKRDLIPGDRAWEVPVPEGDAGTRRVVVIAGE